MTTVPSAAPPPPPSPSRNPREEAVKQRLLRHGVYPTPKILHAIRKKESQKALRREKKRTLALQDEDETSQIEEEEAFFRQAVREYREVRALVSPWEKLDSADLQESWDLGDGCTSGRLKGERLEELRDVLAERNGKKFRWLLDKDVEEEGAGEFDGEGERPKVGIWNQQAGDGERIKWLVYRLTSTGISIQDWKFPWLMRRSGLFFSESVLLRVLNKLGSHGNWSQALAVVEWVYKQKKYRDNKSRFVYTKLLAVLGKARKPKEALRIFNMMREDGQIYPDMAVYHSIAVTLGQAGLVKEVTKIIECMRQKPPKNLKNMKHRHWDPRLEPDVVVYNAVLNACVPTRQWKGVSWVFRQIRQSSLEPTGATYGLAMEVMLESGKYDVVHKLFSTMQRSGLALKSLTYKVLVKAFWREGKVDEAIASVRDMEQRGIVGAASVYYDLSCCLCYHGRWKEAIAEIVGHNKGPDSKPIEVAFTGMILASLDGGHVQDCIAIFKSMKDYCVPNIGTINAMLKVYRHADMFAKAKELFETTKGVMSYFKDDQNVVASLTPDTYSYNTMLEASAAAQQWEYFEHLYKEMTMNGCPLNQRKHAHLLVEASRAGKWHLLEHAFDTILEAGGIPFQSLFTEMLCQSLSRENYEKAIRLVNMMAYASLRITEEHWISLFEKNQNRIAKEKLEKFLELLENGGAVKEDPVCSLIKSLQNLRRRESLPGFATLYAVSANERAAEDLEVDMQRTNGFILDVRNAVTTTTMSMNNGRYCNPPSENSQECVCDNLIQGGTSEPSYTTNPKTSSIDDIIEYLSSGELEDGVSELPSAMDILKSWEQSRMK